MTRRVFWLASEVVCCFLAGGCLFRNGGTPPSGPLELPAVERPPLVVRGGEPVSYPPAPVPEEGDAQFQPSFLVRPEPPKPAPGLAELFQDRVQMEATPAPVKEPTVIPIPPAPMPPGRPPEATVVSALRGAVTKHPTEAGRLLEKTERPDRELLRAVLKLNSSEGEKDLARMSAAEVEAALTQLRQLNQQLGQRAPLSLERICFCRKIEGFGQFVPLQAEHRFEAGNEGQPGEQVRVYAEVRNFTSRPLDGAYETRLSSLLEIYNAAGRREVSLEPPPCVDRSQSPRQDYFLNIQFHVPAKLPPGLYTLWVTVREPGEGAPRLAKRSLDFRVRRR